MRVSPKPSIRVAAHRNGGVVTGFEHKEVVGVFGPAHILASIQTAIAIMPMFSVREMKPSGTLEVT